MAGGKAATAYLVGGVMAFQCRGRNELVPYTRDSSVGTCGGLQFFNRRHLSKGAGDSAASRTVAGSNNYPAGRCRLATNFESRSSFHTFDLLDRRHFDKGS